MFTSDPAIQRVRFATELATLVGSIRQLDTFCSSAHALGARHRDYGARAVHYRLMGAALWPSGRRARCPLDRRGRGSVGAGLQPHGGDDDDGRVGDRRDRADPGRLQRRRQLTLGR